MEPYFLGSLILWRKKGANVLFSLEKNVKEVEKDAEVYKLMIPSLSRWKMKKHWAGSGARHGRCKRVP
jgi:hypothetical protein